MRTLERLRSPFALWMLAVLGCAGTSTETLPVANTCSGTPSTREPVVGVFPHYPMRAAQRGIEGWVDIEVTLLPNGIVKQVEICGLSDDLFMKYALRAVRRWRYDAPAASDPSVFTLRVRFVKDPPKDRTTYFASPQELVVTEEPWSTSRPFGDPVPCENRTSSEGGRRNRVLRRAPPVRAFRRGS